MKISLDWLREYVDTTLSADEIGDILSNLGFPIESTEQVGDDTMLDVEVTSNRGDCLGHIGIARELAAATGAELNIPAIELAESDKDAQTMVQVKINEPALCNRYTARVIEGVNVGPSPEWMQKRLEAIGVRSVNNIVDVTNYIMMETGQPLHAFEYDEIDGQTIIVRKAANDEELISIDETQCKLDNSMLIIADEKNPVAMAGVMGGLDSEVSDATTTILLEAAHFDPVTIRSTARKLVLQSEASFRFERFVDTENIDWVSARCAQLMAEVSGGKVAKGLVDVWPEKRQRETITMRLSRMNALLGIEISLDKVLSIFMALGFSPETKNDDLIACTPPNWRHDLYREADLIEEVARCYGYDNIPVEPKIHIEVAPPNLREKTAGKVRSFLNGAGFYESINVSFVDEKTADQFCEQTLKQHLSVADVSQKNLNLLRQNLIGSLISVMQSNYNVGNRPCRLFELANTFVSNANHKPGQLPNEHTRIGLTMDADFRVMRGVVEELVQSVALGSTIEFKPTSFKWAQIGAEILIDGEVLGIAGLLNPDTAAQFDLDKQVVAATELDFDLLLEKAGAIPAARFVPRFPAIVRDLSLIVDEPVQWAQITSVVQDKAPAELEQIDFGGLYRGKPIPNDKKSITVSLRFRDEQGTLRHETVDGFEGAILTGLADTLGAELRTA
ncbi:MAG: phenylalanine--tRNA ligase subunit beta [Planctomycetota bacterium]|nr:MAG: phenylalanine--tRNA ligase subunit beta [Planctomycetota bacterium]